MKARDAAAAPWRGMKRLGTMVFGRDGWANSLILPASLRKLEELKDQRTASTIMAPVNWITRNFPTAPVTVVEEQTDGTDQTVARHELPALLRKPNPYYTGLTLWWALIAELVLGGNGYLIALRTVDSSTVGELWWAPSSTMTPKGNEREFITHYEYRVNGEVKKLDPDEVIHIRYGMDPDNQRLGMSPLRSVLREVMTDEEAQTFTASLLANMGVPGLVVSPEKGAPAPGPDDVAATKTYIRDNFGGSKRGEPLVMSGATSVEQFGFSPEQLNLRELRRIPEERVTAVLGVAAIVAGLGAGLDRSTFSNFSEAREASYEECIIPLQDLVAAELTLQLLPLMGGTEHQRVEHDRSKVRILQEDQSKKVERLNTAVVGGWLPVDYAQREGFGIEPTDADNVYLRSLNTDAVPVGVVVEDEPPELPPIELPPDDDEPDDDDEE